MSTPKQGFQDIRKITTLEKKSEPSDCHINWTQCQERFLCEALLLKALQSQKDIKTIDWQERGNRNHKRSIRQLPAGGGDTPAHGALRGASSGHVNRIGTEPLIKIIFIFTKGLESTPSGIWIHFIKCCYYLCLLSMTASSLWKP